MSLLSKEFNIQRIIESCESYIYGKPNCLLLDIRKRTTETRKRIWKDTFGPYRESIFEYHILCSIHIQGNLILM